MLWKSCVISGVTTVGVTRGVNSRVSPQFFLKNRRPILSHYRLSVLQCHPYFLLKNWRPFLLITVICYHFYWFHSGVTPRRCHPRPFLPVRPRFSTVLYKFSHQFFSIRVSSPWRMSPGTVQPPPPSDATSCIINVSHTSVQFYSVLFQRAFLDF